MSNYTRDIRLKEFSQKFNYDKHTKNKRPYKDNKGKTKEVVENFIINKN
jgi:hypothetical protein